MKFILLGIAMASLSFTSCNNNNTPRTDNKASSDTSKTGEQTSQLIQKDSATIQNVLTEYLRVKNALVSGNAKDAAEASKSLNKAIDSVGRNLMSETQRKAFSDIGDDSKEHAEHIGESAGDIKHQREHFQLLSKDIYDLVKVFGSSQTIYKDYCPMVKAIWLSETKPIKNPYYGSKMLTCGQVQETIEK